MAATIRLTPNTEDAEHEYRITPLRATKYSAGVDLRANIEKTLVIHKGQGATIPTGIHVRMSSLDCALVLPRSGLAGHPHFATITNAPGLIDPDYEGEIFVNLFVLGKVLSIEPGDRIAQLVCVRPESIGGCVKLRDTVRTGGLGSTGISDNEDTSNE